MTPVISKRRFSTVIMAKTCRSDSAGAAEYPVRVAGGVTAAASPTRNRASARLCGPVRMASAVLPRVAWRYGGRMIIDMAIIINNRQDIHGKHESDIGAAGNRNGQRRIDTTGYGSQVAIIIARPGQVGEQIAERGTDQIDEDDQQGRKRQSAPDLP